MKDKKGLFIEMPSLFFLFAGLTTVMLLLDDLFLFHEYVARELLNIPEKIVLLTYILIIIAFLVKHKSDILGTEFMALILARGFFGLSILVERLPESLLPSHHLG